jgi:small conductance mechanosensitive channel
VSELWESLYRLMVLDYGPRVAGAAIILLVGWLVLRFVTSPLARLLGRTRLDPSVVSFVVNSARALLVAAVLLAALNKLGVATASLLTLLGAAGLAVALSLQGSLANFASGLLVLSYRTVRVGDVIEVGDVRGRVSELLPFHVVVVTADNQRITLPNTLLTSGPVRNNTALATRRVGWALPLAAGDDLDAVRQAVRARLAADPRVFQEPPPEVYVQEWTEARRVLAVNAWTTSAVYLAVQAELLEGLGKAAEAVRRPTQ